MCLQLATLPSNHFSKALGIVHALPLVDLFGMKKLCLGLFPVFCSFVMTFVSTENICIFIKRCHYPVTIK